MKKLIETTLDWMIENPPPIWLPLAMSIVSVILSTISIYLHYSH